MKLCTYLWRSEPRQKRESEINKHLKPNHVGQFPVLPICVIGFKLNGSSFIPAYPMAFLIGMLGQFRVFQKTLFGTVFMFSELQSLWSSCSTNVASTICSFLLNHIQFQFPRHQCPQCLCLVWFQVLIYDFLSCLGSGLHGHIHSFKLHAFFLSLTGLCRVSWWTQVPKDWGLVFLGDQSG
jgi:hypothetical protein